MLFAATVNAQSVDFKKNNFPNDRDGLEKAIDNFEKGDEFYNQGIAYYKMALEPYLLANTFNPNNSFLNFKIGKCYLFSSTKQKAISFLEKAQNLNPNIDVQLPYYLAWAYQLDMQWDKAIEQYKKFGLVAGSGNEFMDLQNEARLNIKECETGKELQ